MVKQADTDWVLYVWDYRTLDTYYGRLTVVTQLQHCSLKAGLVIIFIQMSKLSFFPPSRGNRISRHQDLKSRFKISKYRDDERKML